MTPSCSNSEQPCGASAAQDFQNDNIFSQGRRKNRQNWKQGPSVCVKAVILAKGSAKYVYLKSTV